MAARRTYVPPYELVRMRLGFQNREHAKAEVTITQLEDALRLLLRAVAVDEPWYRHTYPDVADAIDSGLFKSARDHFIQNGWFEGRRPYEIEVDEDWYLATYDDVAEGVETGGIVSATDHFYRHGWREGRWPHEP